MAEQSNGLMRQLGETKDGYGSQAVQARQQQTRQPTSALCGRIVERPARLKHRDNNELNCVLAALVTRVDGAYQPGVCKRAVVPSWIRTCVPLFPLLGLGAERGAERERERVCDIVIYDEPDLGRGIS